MLFEDALFWPSSASAVIPHRQSNSSNEPLPFVHQGPCARCVRAEHLENEACVSLQELLKSEHVLPKQIPKTLKERATQRE